MTVSAVVLPRDLTVTELSHEPEEALACRVQRGDALAFEILFNRHYAGLTAYAFSITRVAESAHDVVGDVFLALWRGRSQWNPGNGVRAYLFTSVRNRALNVRRGEQRAAAWQVRLRQEWGTIAGEIDGPVEQDEQRWAVKRAIATLPEKRRAVMTLRWHHQMEIPEIAQVLDMSENAVRMHLSKGVRMIRALVTGENAK